MPILEFLINPFSEEAKKIVKSVEKIPPKAYELAFRKISLDYKDTLEYDESDLISFYLLFNAALLKGRASLEARTVKKIVALIIGERIRKVISQYGYSKGYDYSFISRILSQLLEVKLVEELGIPEKELRKLSKSITPEEKVRFAVSWRYLLKGKIPLTDAFIYNGYALINLKELIALSINLIEAKIENYFATAKVGEDEKLGLLSQEISKISNAEYLSKYASKVAPAMKSLEIEVKGLKEEYFPPCIKKTLLGVSAGSRNYAITVLLTSFLSYARIAPIGAKRNAKISDYLNDISVIKNEILPIIYQAAENSSPPLFEDQPTEKMNIIYHLGFGLTEEPRLEDAGKSKWYFPPNCEKIRREAPSLCEPDEFCKSIKNPLSYYTKKLMREGVKVKGKIIEIFSGEMRFYQKIRAKIKTEEGNRYIVIIKGKLAEKILGKKETSELLGKEFVFKGRKVGNKILVREIE